ncbi:MAG: EAL domain-containing protein [Devosia nanyangense]|uniref:EAL domain-containing protein n=1 Tax=Devosia nanyangense TaxID=1228055 RepID=A0A933KY83_9HYPH|nr:EAL domain-containing protein [Devosia nanyangense]
MNVESGAGQAVQGLVYLFIALAALGVAGTAYFGLTFTPIEAAVTAVAFGCLAVLLVERQLRRRAEARLEKAVEDLSRLLSTDAQAGSVLSQRINALTEIKAGPRLDSVESDLAVLGEVVRQVTETVADLEEQRRLTSDEPKPEPEPDPDLMPEPVIPLELLRQAIEDGRLVFHIEPIVTLPQRKTHGYDLVPRLVMEEGEFADRADFMPRHGGEEVIAKLEADAVDEAVVITRRSRTAGTPITLHVPISHATLGSAKAVELILAALDANRAILGSLLFAVEQVEFKALSPKERASLAAIGKMGVGLSLSAANSLRFDYAELQGLGFKSVRIDATRFLRQPEGFTDFHAADVAAYGRRFGIELIATGIIDEQQLLALFEDGLTLAQGPHIARPGPVRPDLQLDRPAAARAEA